MFSKNISDDIYIGGIENDTHDQYLRPVFSQLHRNEFTINLPKCQFRVPTMLFFGHVFSEKGISPDPTKVEALQRVAPPTSGSEVQSLLSSAEFCSRFIKDFAVITRRLRKLACNGLRWQWTQEEQSSFDLATQGEGEELALRQEPKKLGNSLTFLCFRPRIFSMQICT